MIKAVVFDMFETLVSLFEGRTYFSENIADDLGVDVLQFQKEWHAIEVDRSRGKYTIKEGLEIQEDELLREADRWELNHGGISGRTARQFVNYLLSRVPL